MKAGLKRTTTLRVIRIIHMLRDGMRWGEIADAMSDRQGASPSHAARVFLYRAMKGEIPSV